MNATRTGYSTTSVGRRGSKSSSASKVYMYYPYDLTLDTNNNRLIIADRSKSSVQFFDLNLGFIKELEVLEQMSGAHEAIQAIVSDPALKAELIMDLVVVFNGEVEKFGIRTGIQKRSRKLVPEIIVKRKLTSMVQVNSPSCKV